MLYVAPNVQIVLCAAPDIQLAPRVARCFSLFVGLPQAEYVDGRFLHRMLLCVGVRRLLHGVRTFVCFLSCQLSLVSPVDISREHLSDA